MKVVLNNKEWEIIRTKASKTMDGWCDHNKGKIMVFNNVRPEDLAETYVHEFLHALFPEIKEAIIERSARELTIALCKCGIKFKRKKNDGP